ncbi:MAG TPA: AAA family ATPase [Ktedonobacteraceae bacterium]|nr:AAA family ATPase [Ktedonobacteraceae bacterium]
MTGASNLPQQIKRQLLQTLSVKDPEVKIQVQRNTFGWLRLSIVTNAFEGTDFEEREHEIDKILDALNLKLHEYPFANYQLLTPQEDEKQTQSTPVQLPLWSEILSAPDPEEPVTIDEDNAKPPFVVTFYSFKGGVGRSTSLALVANLLATRGRRVVMIDFDLEAPGLSFMHPIDIPEATTYGVLDYIYQRYLTPDQDEPKIDDCIRQISIPTRGELYLVPAGEYDEGYVHRLADLDVHSLYQSETNPIHQLLNDVKNTLDPDIILIDARTGFTEMGAIALFDQADLGVICFSPTNQSFAGLEWVVKAASKQRKYNGIPDLRFLLTPMPPVAQAQQQEWLNRTADWITQYWGVPSPVTVDELYYPVPYNPSIITLDSLFAEVPTAILDPYIPVADAISASLPEKNVASLANSDIKIADSRSSILDELKFLSPTAQEMAPAEIPNIFQRTGDFPKFLQDRTWLIRGAKGTGKTLLFRLFIEQSVNARKLAEPYEKLHNVQFVPGHGPIKLSSTLLASGSLKDYEKLVGQQKWAEFWAHYLLLQLAMACNDLQSLLTDPFLIGVRKHKTPSQEEILAWLSSRILSPLSSSRILDELQTINAWLGKKNERIWILYDELDTGFGQSRRSALEALLGWWLEVGPALGNISPKILLREDIWTGLNFTNKTYYVSRTVQLRWEEEDLWRLVLRQAFTSPTLAKLIQQQASIEASRLDSILQLEVLRKGLFPLWGELMGRKNKAYTYNWVRKRIGDYKENRFPRSLILLLQHAVENEKTAYDRNPYEAVLRPRSLIEALPKVSEERVSEVYNEYSEFEVYLKKLAGERSPIGVERLEAIWEVDRVKLKELVTGMTAAGILQEYTSSRPLLPDSEARYSVAELYLSGLKMTRLGQR